MNQLSLFAKSDRGVFPELPYDWEPEKPANFFPDSIILAKGSLSTPQREKYARRICEAFPESDIIEKLETPHSKIEISGISLLERHYAGKKTLVIGELFDAVRFSEEKSNTCPNYWHFSPYGFCFYDCQYCYLAGTMGVKFSPTVEVFVNLPDMLAKIDSIASRVPKPTAFYIGKLQDGLSLDPLTGYSKVMIPFFAQHPKARLILLTKSAEIENLLKQTHQEHTILSWSLSPDVLCKEFEKNTPSLEDRFRAMEKCFSIGYPVRAVVMPLIPVNNWKNIYGKFTEELLTRIPIARLTLGGICTYQGAYRLMTEKSCGGNVISDHIVFKRSPDGRMRYSRKLREEMYSFIIEEAHKRHPNLNISLCLEEKNVWESTGLINNLGKCNCAL